MFTKKKVCRKKFPAVDGGFWRSAAVNDGNSVGQ